VQNQLTAIIVDDERLARKDLITLLSKHSIINVVGEADNVSASSQTIELHNLDVMHKICRLSDNING
jgi:two-component system LytT family response regulator